MRYDLRLEAVQMQRNKHRRKRLTAESELLEQARLAVEDAKQLLRDTKKVLAENARLRKQLRKLIRNLNWDTGRTRV
jgi:hypothetical protein